MHILAWIMCVMIVIGVIALCNLWEALRARELIVVTLLIGAVALLGTCYMGGILEPGGLLGGARASEAAAAQVEDERGEAAMVASAKAEQPAEKKTLRQKVAGLIGNKVEDALDGESSPVRTTEELIAAGEAEKKISADNPEGDGNYLADEVEAAGVTPPVIAPDAEPVQTSQAQQPTNQTIRQAELAWYIGVRHGSVVVISWIVAVILFLVFLGIMFDENLHGASIFLIASFLVLQFGGGLYLFTPFVGPYILPTWLAFLMVVGVVAVAFLAFVDYKHTAAGTFVLALIVLQISGYGLLDPMGYATVHKTGIILCVVGYIIGILVFMLFGWWEKSAELAEIAMEQKKHWMKRCGAPTDTFKVPDDLVSDFLEHARRCTDFDLPDLRQHYKSFYKDAIYWLWVYGFRLFNDLIPTVVKAVLMKVFGPFFDIIVGKQRSSIDEALAAARVGESGAVAEES